MNEPRRAARRGAWREPAIAMGGAALLWLAGAFLPGARLDEVVHLRQARTLAAGTFALDPELTMLPTFHAVAAALLRLLGDGLVVARIATLAAALLLAWATVDAARALDRPDPAWRAVQVLALPLVAPLVPLLYTDVAGLALVVLAVGRAARGRTAAASAALLVASLVRQTLVVWAPAIALLALASPALRAAPVAVRARHALAIVAPPAALLAALLLGPGLVVGAADAHRPGIYPANVAFGLFVATALFLPIGWSQRTVIARELRDVPFVSAGALGAVAFLAAFAPLTHPLNREPTVLPNRLLVFLFGDPEGRAWLALGAVLGGLGALGIVLPALRGDRGRIVAALCAGALVTAAASELVEPRYLIVPAALFTLLRPAASFRIELALALLFAALDVYFFDGLWRERWFPL